jgi:hypothetical protein
VLRIIREGKPTAYVDGALRQVEKFLRERFSDGELRMIVRRLTQGDSLEAQLVGQLASRAQLANSVVEVLWRSNRVDKEFFLALLGERIAFVEEIQAVARVMSIDISKREETG